MSDDSEKIRILTVDDHPILRQDISAIIQDESDMALVAETANGLEAVQPFRTHRPDVTLMDLQMPEMMAKHLDRLYGGPKTISA